MVGKAYTIKRARQRSAWASALGYMFMVFAGAALLVGVAAR